jgi:hypothetical protein
MKRKNIYCNSEYFAECPICQNITGKAPPQEDDDEVIAKFSMNNGWTANEVEGLDFW